MFDPLTRQLLKWQAYAAHRKKLRAMRLAPDRSPVVAFGGVLDRQWLVHGGAVKLLQLRSSFASNETTFNTLYLVSSSPADFPDGLVKRCRKLGIRFVWNQNGVGYPAWAGRQAERHNAPMRKLRAEADYVVYQSQFCRESADKFLGPCPVPGEILFNPVDLEKFRPSSQPLPGEALRLLAMGTQNYAARVLSTIDAVRALRDAGKPAQLTVAGRLLWNNAEAEVREKITKLELAEAVKILPAFTQDEAAELYRGHHILLHPKYLDPCPTVVIEALASGLPVIGSKSGGLPEMVPASCGELIPVPLTWEKLITPSGDELASAVLKIAPRLTEYSHAARRQAEENFSAARWIMRHAEIFHRLLR